MDHLKDLSDAFSSLFLNDKHSDVTLTVGTTHFPAHKIVLCARSDYFRGLLDGGLRESKAAVVALDVANEAAGRQLLHYLYTGRLDADVYQSMDKLLNLLEAAHKFHIESLLEHVADTLGATLSVEYVVQTFTKARLFELKALEERVLHFMDTHASELLIHPFFLQLTMTELQTILPRESFFAMETSILQGVMRWLDDLVTREEDVADELQGAADALLRHVRLKFISFEEALGLLDESHRQFFVRHRSLEPPIATPRVETTHSTNLGSFSFGNGHFTFAPPSSWSTSNNVWLPSTPSADGGKLLRFKLAPQRLINEVYLELSSKDTEFYVQTSLSGEHWERVCGTCRGGGAQVIKFLPRVVGFLQIFVKNDGVRSDTFRLVHR